MKKLCLPLVFAALLTACGSDSKPTSAGSGTNQNGPATKCVELNGTYTRKVTINGEDGQVREESNSLKIRTKIEAASYQYSINDGETFLTADGQIRDLESEGQQGKLQVACDATSVTVIARQEDQEPFKIRYVALSPTQLRVESESEDASSIQGLYTKE